MSLTLTSESFANNEVIPKKFGYKHGNTSPPLRITNIPENTVSLALIMDDPDAMAAVGKVWVHWVVWNIVKENSIPSGSIEGETDFGEIGYGGPAPPDKEHTYIFKLFALDKKLEIAKGSTKTHIENEMKNHILEETTLQGKYSP
jgi:Raf kinase inhibitor-like YbhB/YbcL family protein